MTSQITKDRHRFIGGSDVYGIIMGNKKHIIEQKLNIKKEKSFILKEILHHGNTFEFTAHVLCLYLYVPEEHRKNVIYCPPSAFHSKYHFYRGNADAIDPINKIIYEYKCPTARKTKPHILEMKYFLQVQFYLELYDYKIGVVWIYIADQEKSVCYKIRRDKEVFQYIHNYCKRFYEDLNEYIHNKKNGIELDKYKLFDRRDLQNRERIFTSLLWKNVIKMR